MIGLFLLSAWAAPVVVRSPDPGLPLEAEVRHRVAPDPSDFAALQRLQPYRPVPGPSSAPGSGPPVEPLWPVQGPPQTTANAWTLPPVPLPPPPPDPEAAFPELGHPLQVGDVVTPSVPMRPDEVPALRPSSLDGPLLLTRTAPDPNRVATVPADTFFKVRLLTGVAVTSERSRQLPLRVEVVAVAHGPNRAVLDLRGCRAQLAMTADLSTIRAYGSATTLSCVAASGEAVSLSLAGEVYDTDGTIGLRGHFRSREGGQIAAAILASLVDGVGGALSKSQEVTQIVPGALGAPSTTATNVQGGVVPYALGLGSQTAAREVAQWYLQRASELVPYIEIAAGREAWLALREPLAVPALVRSR